MGFKLDRVHVWSGEIADQPGGMAGKLALLAQAGANLEYIFTQRQPDKPGTGILYIAPVSGAVQVRAAKAAGLSETFRYSRNRAERNVARSFSSENAASGAC